MDRTKTEDSPAQTALKLRQKAAAVREAAKARLAAAEEQAQAIEFVARMYEAEASGVDTTALQEDLQYANIREMQTAHRVHLSAAHASPDDRLTTAANKASPPHSVNSLAKAVRVSPTLLRNAHKGKGSIKESVAIRVRDVIGKDEKGHWIFPATVENWPNLRLGK